MTDEIAPHADPFRRGYCASSVPAPEGGWPMDVGFVDDVRQYLHWYTRLDELAYEVRHSCDYQARCLDVLAVARGDSPAAAIAACQVQIRSRLWFEIRGLLLSTFSEGRDGRLKPAIVGWLDDLALPEHRKYLVTRGPGQQNFTAQPRALPERPLQTQCLGLDVDLAAALARSHDQVRAEAVLALRRYVDALALVITAPQPPERPTNAVMIPCTPQARAWPARRGQWGEFDDA